MEVKVMKNKKVLAMVMAAAITFGGAYSAYGMDSDMFTDVSNTSDYFSSIENMVDRNVMQGMTDTEFGVDAEVSRADLVTYMFKLINSPKVNGSLVYEDVEGTGYEEAVIWAESDKLFVGLAESFFQDGNFSVDQGITRAQACQMLMNYAKNSLKIDTSKNIADSIENYEDNADVLAVYTAAVKWAVGNDLLNERDDKLAPNDVISKKEVAEFLYKLSKMVTDESVEIVELESEEDLPEVVKPDWQGNNEGNENNDNNLTHQHIHNWVQNVVDGQGHYENVLVKPAWTEEIKHPEKGHYETVVDEEAWTEEIPISAEQGHSERVEVVDKEAWTEEIEHPEEGHYEDVVVKEAWDEEVVHPAETHEEWVVDKEAVYGPDKWVVDKEAWDEVIHHEAEYETVHHEAEYKHHEAVYETVHHEEEGHYDFFDVCYNCGFKTQSGSEIRDHIRKNYENGCVQYGTHQEWVVDKPAWDEQGLVKEAWDELIKEAWDEQVLVKEAWDDTVHHEEEGHYEKGDLISPEEGHYETIIDKPEWTETIHHDAIVEKQWIVDKEAWTETVEHPAETHWEWQWVVDVEGKTDIIEHPAKTHEEWVVDKEAWVETVKHPAEYKKKYILDTPNILETVCSECGEVKSREELQVKDLLKK